MIDLNTTKQYFTEEDEGVSPVIGVILMVAVTVALVALVTVIIFDLTEGTSEPALASVTIDQQEDKVLVQVTSNENVDEFIIEKDGEEVDRIEGIGTEEYEQGDGRYKVIGIVDGSKTILQSDDFDGISDEGG